MSTQPKISGPLSGRPGIYGGRYSKWTVIVPIFLFGVAIAVIATTLAANQQGLTDANPEIQGVANIESCNGSQVVNLKPYAKFKNESGAGQFLFTGVKVGNIKATSAGCAGKEFIILGVSDSATTQALFKNPSGSDMFEIRVLANLGGTYTIIDNTSGLSIQSLATSSADDTGFIIDLPRQEDAAGGAYAVTPAANIAYLSLETID